ncbi:hypothetical protein [Cupriavidus sp. UYPR2.512]|uniref:hypothetical protein n=1 Tax=Cupriavidus sp. UYPR2.512 TaxID=1080187 RepID=UPI000372422A|nr:hypothetical protein [Cupriavidus sp. UYPR2.512]UIF86202.1 hypothetical protein KAF44_00365 [Cupriavidus necator]
MFTPASRFARRAANLRFAPTDVTMLRSGSTEEVGEGVGEGDGRFAAGLSGVGKDGAVRKVDALNTGAQQKRGDAGVVGVDFSRGPDKELDRLVKVAPVGLAADEADLIIERVPRTFRTHDRTKVRPLGTCAELPPKVQASYQREHC